MGKYSDEEIRNAIELRKKHHYSYVKIHSMTGIPANTIRNWCHKIKGNRWETLLLSNERKRKEILLSEKLPIKDVDQSWGKIIAGMLYWCEGSKYPVTNKVEFTNSDPNLIKLFLNLLRMSFKIDESKIKVKLQIHSTHNQKIVFQYWSELLNIPVSQFMKPTVTNPNGKKHRARHFGTCTVRYSDYKILLKLTGIYQSFSKKLLA